MARITDLRAGRDHPLLLEISGSQGMDRGVRSVLAGAWPLSRVAMTVSSPVDEVIVDSCQARHAPSWPGRLFTSAQEAMGWLRRAVDAGEVTAAADAQDDPK
ncbi:DUF7793 family protein [Arthrobacter globiformis]|uniref:DUF7793 family protein n=1 Tax=Arthrobacter globiformis TaxID=1665 RepID=UPI004038A222